MSKLSCALYARVSTKDQHCEMQLTALRAFAKRAGWKTVEYIEKASSVKHRPVFERMLADARAGKVEVVLVWRIDRFARSMRDFVEITLQLATWKVRLVSSTENVDSGNENPLAKFLLSLLALLAELERNIIVERSQSGQEEYRRAFEAGEVGRKRHSKSGKDLPVGRPRAVFDREKAREMRRAGASYRVIARAVGVGVDTVHRAIA